jgi:ABC-2 type transport system permease protein
VDGLRFKVTDPFISYLKKELKILTRTRAYASNCVYINLLWPFGVFILFYLNRNSDGMNDFIEMYIDGTYPRAELIVLLAVIAVSFIACAMNSLASTAFTREGLHADVIKYLPMNFSAQLRAKAFVSILLTWPAVIAAILVAAYYLKIPAPTMVFYIVLSLAALLLSVMTGLLMDSSAPYTEWSDEYSALRGNLNSFFNMAVAMLIALFLCAIAFLSYEFVHIGIVADHFIVLGVIIAADIPMLTLGRKRVLKNMQEMY